MPNLAGEPRTRDEIVAQVQDYLHRPSYSRSPHLGTQARDLVALVLDGVVPSDEAKADKAARAAEKPWTDPLDRQPGDVLIDRNSLAIEWRVLDVARIANLTGRYSAQYRVERVDGFGEARWKPSEDFGRN